MKRRSSSNLSNTISRGKNKSGKNDSNGTINDIKSSKNLKISSDTKNDSRSKSNKKSNSNDKNNSNLNKNINKKPKKLSSYNNINTLPPPNFEFTITPEFKSLINLISDNINNNNYNSKPTYVSKPYNDKNPIIHKLSNITDFKTISPIELFYKSKYDYNTYKNINNSSNITFDKCSICLGEFYDSETDSDSSLSSCTDIKEVINLSDSQKNNYDVILLKNCNDHFFHLTCLDSLLLHNKTDSYLKCPICNNIYGILTGDQPKGTMISYVDKKIHCDGYPNFGTIIIEYYFPNTRKYKGTDRVAYLPDNKEGNKILNLLKVAFDRKLLFTVGTSVTTGKSNTTIWNGVHHKTSLTGGSQFFGYPDKTYFNRVEQELAAKGVV